jgi:GT2 family glycosyltransferase/DNA-binding beta-propeller fold protein YncE
VRVTADGKFLRAGDDRFLVKGVSYGTFAPDADGRQFPSPIRVAEDFRQMADLGINTVRVYTPPTLQLLDQAAERGLRVMVGLPWSQHTAFLDDPRQARAIRRELTQHVRELGGHPAALLFALGNEIPAAVVRWHGRTRVERFMRDLYIDAKSASPESLFTYVNFPPTEFLDLSGFDVCAFNVYLHREPELRAYLARLQNVAGHKPLLLAEAGADSQREGLDRQASITAMHVRAAFEEGACGAVAFAWTDEWWRGGSSVDDWSFGLVDHERRPKPAAAAVAAAFADAPFSAEARTHWPRVSVVVCAYNAADTLDDCLTSLQRLDYPDYEVVLVNDGSRDRTGEIASSYDGVRVIETPNRGLSAARNTGLAAANGSIVAYTDADTRADRHWLAHLVQPFLGSLDVVGSGGPNVVPADDPMIAQCVGRAPGGPTHVLLEDRVAEHVPGCNMAFRRDALLSIGGFNPIFLRAGDDVDVCWRLQARGWKIGFAAAAHVWHHHRASTRAYWRQQVGYGEGETWLMAQHPEKFLDGHMLWRGRMYSPLPSIRSLWGTKVNAGPWGTAAFPSVYRTDARVLAFLPHTIQWQALSLVLLLVGTLAIWLGAGASGVTVLAAGLGGAFWTLARNALYALRSDTAGVGGSRLAQRFIIAYLHFIQPIARAWGRMRGTLTPPEAAHPVPSLRSGARPDISARDGLRAALLLSGSVTEDRFWSEDWTSADRVLTKLAEKLRRALPKRTVVVDDGWSEDRDLSVLVGRWAWLDVRALVEEHERGKCLMRVGTSLRPTPLGVTAAIGLGIAVVAVVVASVLLQWLPVTGLAAVATLAMGAVAVSRTALSAAVVRQSVHAVVSAQRMLPIPIERPSRAPLLVPSPVRAYGMRAAAILLVTIPWLGASAFLVGGPALLEGLGPRVPTRDGPALTIWSNIAGDIAVAPDGDILVADASSSVVRRIFEQSLLVTPFAGNQALGPGFSGDGGDATAAMLNGPEGLAIAPDGDLIIADAYNHRIRRVDRATATITTIAGSGWAGYDGEARPALEAALYLPSAVAVAPNGDIYIADTMNNRVRKLDHATGLINTVAGNGIVVDDGDVGDGGAATLANLYMPIDLAISPEGDLYIADLHHNRVRKVDALSQVITTVAGDGTFTDAPDVAPATAGGLKGPAGIVLVPGEDGQTTLYVSESYGGRVRMVSPDGTMSVVGKKSGVLFGSPTRLAYAPVRGWLYVADAAEDRVVALAIPEATRP